MKKLLLILAFILIATTANAQCVAEIRDVRQDEVRGSIIVETQYKLDGVVVQTGHTRYNETSGTNAEIIAKAKEDVEEHCGNIIRRIEANALYLKTQKLAEQKDQTTPIINSIKATLVGHEKQVDEVTDYFKGKDIKVTHDGKNTTTDSSTAYTPNAVE